MINADGSISDATLEVALAAVRGASRLTAAAQGRLVAGETITKGDDSPVTVADFAAQAIVCSTLVDGLGDVAIVGEEDASDLRDGSDASTTLLAGVTALVSNELGRDIDGGQVADWVGMGSSDASEDVYWTLDPIDGTKGFLRGDQFAIALGLIAGGEVVLGVLGCPNMSNADGSTGAVFVGANGRSEMYLGGAGRAVPVTVDDPATLAEARLCESVESGHSDHDQSVQIARALGVTTDPFRIDSQCKYGAIARGDASIYLRLPTRADYVEKIWDHAAGKFVVEQAGGTVTDVTGAPLDFSKGARLSANSGVVATSGRFHDEVITAVTSVLG
ncbi:MAG: 3'(2'),5'-bisphosphate nucleotidase [Ilumatobacter sp.]